MNKNFEGGMEPKSISKKSSTDDVSNAADKKGKNVRKCGNYDLRSKIEWTGRTWNPVTGCVKYSDGCQHCYAEGQSIRCKGFGHLKYRNGFIPTIHSDLLNEPYAWKKPQLVFVCSMSDLFQDAVPDPFIQDLFRVMNDTPQHTYQILTKRSKRLADLSPSLQWTDNIWCGVTVESNKYLHRIDHLRSVESKTKFLSCEPLLSSLTDADFTGIDLAIVQGESGNKARPIQADWVREIRNKCEKQHVNFFFKGWGGRNKKVSGDLLDGIQYKNLPKLN